VCRPGYGSDWHAVYVPVWEATGRDAKLAAQFIGLILWEVMYNRGEGWIFIRLIKPL
jgi:hypothetical protein